MSKEKLSALIDGELLRDEQRNLLSKIKSDEDLRLSWETYYAIRAVIKNINKNKKISDFKSQIVTHVENDNKSKRTG